MTMKKYVIGLCAHVDAGKTTLAEALLYHFGTIRSKGRVDSKNAFLDTTDIEKERGITVFSHQAVIRTDDRYYTLLDTPGHADFTVQAEQCFSVLDCAILLISASDGVQSHTRTLWRLLSEHGIPTFIFVNKTDIMHREKKELFESISRDLDAPIADLSEDIYENSALACEELFEPYLNGELNDDMIARAISERRLFGLVWGSALKSENIDTLVDMLERFAPCCPEREEFGAKVFKITTDQGKLLTHFKMTGGKLSVKDSLGGGKINSLRIYSGTKYEQVDTVYCGQVAAAIGIEARAGDHFGCEQAGIQTRIMPVMRFSVSAACDSHTLFGRLKAMENDIPTLDTAVSDEVTVSVMGEMELDVIRQLYLDAYGDTITFGSPKIRYMETIRGSVSGVGHYEPLRHYAEVVVRIEAGEHGSGIIFGTDCPEDILSTAKQRTVLSALESKAHKGVLTGAPLTDVRITLTAARLHIKHTEGGDIYQAASRAVRQGLMKADNVLLEPYYDLILCVPQTALGRALNDLNAMEAEYEAPEISSMAVIKGYGAVSELWDYQNEVRAYTKGEGSLEYIFKGYYPAKKQAEIVENTGYDPTADLQNSPDSIFCSHGAGISVRWDVVEEHMHTDGIDDDPISPVYDEITPAQIARFQTRLYSDEELMAVFERTYGKIDRPERQAMRREPERIKTPKPRPLPDGPDYLLVDGYNIIFAWDELKELARTSLDHARHRLEDILANFAGFRECEVILVFDAYKIKGQKREIERRGKVTIVYTKEAETADMYIERTTHELKKARRIRVATSDYAEQLIILGNGALRVSAGEFLLEVEDVNRAIRKMIEG